MSPISQNSKNPRGTAEKKRILLVDDEQSITHFYSRILSNRLDCVVATALDGEQALIQLSKDSFDLIITDITMPHMSGLELARMALELNPRLPIIIISGYCTNEVFEGFRLECLIRNPELKHLSFLAKPVSVKELEERIHLAISDCGEHPSEQLTETSNSDDVQCTKLVDPRLLPFVIGGLLHDARNTMFALHEKSRRLARLYKENKLENLQPAIEFVSEQVSALGKVMTVVHQITQEHYKRDDQFSGYTPERILEIVSDLESMWPSVKFICIADPTLTTNILPAGIGLFVIRELLLNAAKASAGFEDSLVTIEANQEPDQTLSIRCTNSRGHVPKEVMDRIQINDLRPNVRANGGGHGLYFISEITKRLGGHLRAENLPISGAVVHVRLPTHQKTR